MNFTDLLRLVDLSPKQVSLVLHKPGNSRTRSLLATWVEERPEFFEAYQSTHPSIQEATVKSRKFLASFLMRESGELTFLRLYEVAGWTGPDPEALVEDPTFRKMIEAADDIPAARVAADISLRFAERMRFELRPLDRLSTLSRRLVVADPGARNYVRLAETTDLPVLEVTRTARVSPPMPPWDELAIDAPDLGVLPRDWIARLSNWRGIYLIVDRTDGERYVGAAYGDENLYGRWRAHVAFLTGITAQLRKRQTSRFRFSILELVAPTAEPREVIARERTWMQRLDTITSGLNS